MPGRDNGRANGLPLVRRDEVTAADQPLLDGRHADREEPPDAIEFLHYASSDEDAAKARAIQSGGFSKRSPVPLERRAHPGRQQRVGQNLVDRRLSFSVCLGEPATESDLSDFLGDRNSQHAG
jgi:hypothetical protein